MQWPSVKQSVYKLALAGEQAGFSIEELNAGLTLETLLNLIERRLNGVPAVISSSRWIM